MTHEFVLKKLVEMLVGVALLKIETTTRKNDRNLKESTTK